jgi:hypothetical protein
MMGTRSMLSNLATAVRESRSMRSGSRLELRLKSNALRTETALLLVISAVALLSLITISDAWGKPLRGIDHSIVAVDTNNSDGEVLTFKQGSRGNIKPTYLNDALVEP